MGKEERWLPVAGFAYLVSNLGRVRGPSGKILKQKRKAHGYRFVTLCGPNWLRKDAHVSRLVCAAFNGPPPNPDDHADHIDGDRGNNRDDNLRWLTPEANRALRKHPRGAHNHNAKLTEEEVRQIKSVNAPHSVIAQAYAVERRQISRIKQGTRWRHIA